MHILIIASWYKKSMEEVHAPFIEEQARMLLNAGFNVGVFHPYFTGGFKDRIRRNKEEVENFDDNGLQTWYYGEKSVVPFFRNIIYDHLCKNAEKVFLEYVKKNGKPDILHAHSVFMGGIFSHYLSKKYKIPYLITEHATKLITDFKLLNKADYDYIKIVLENSTQSIYVSSFQQSEMTSNFQLKNNNKSVINNVLNPIFKYQPLFKNKSKFTIIIIGGLTERKNHIMLFDAIKILQARNIECIVKVIGDGVYRDKLENYVSSNLLNNNIVFYGALSRSKVFMEIINSHCVVSVSKFETFGVNLIEGLGVGRPIISTNSGGPSEIVSKENGILLKSYKVEELVNAIIYMKENYNNYNLKNISTECHKRYSEEIILTEVSNLYKKILR